MSLVPFPIHHTFAPLATREQVWQAFQLQFEPWKWWSGIDREHLRRELSRSFGMSASLFATGREALLALLRALELKTGEEVILQGFTCIAVPNAIHAAGGSAVFADIDPETLSLDCEKVQRAITPRTRAVICQHTFGIPADTVRLRSITEKRGLLLIEDCAHVIPDGATGGVGVHGDVLIFSFGRDKAISGVTGGAALTRNPALASALESQEKQAVSLSFFAIANLIGYPLRYYIAKWIWDCRLPFGAAPGLAKAYLRLIKLMKLLPAVYRKGEKEGKVGLRLHQLPNACAALALEQLRSLGALNAHRRKLTAMYLSIAKERGWHVPAGVTRASSLLKFSLYVKNPDRVRENLKREQIYLDDGWNGAVVNPRDVIQESAGYAVGSCPRAEEVARHILTLPLHPTMTQEQAQYLVHALRSSLR